MTLVVVIIQCLSFVLEAIDTRRYFGHAADDYSISIVVPAALSTDSLSIGFCIVEFLDGGEDGEALPSE